MGTIPLASASIEVVIRLPEEKGDAADVKQSLSSAHPSLAGLICTCMFWERAKDDFLLLLHIEISLFFSFQLHFILLCKEIDRSGLSFLIMF